MLRKTSACWLVAVVALILPLTLPAAEKGHGHQGHSEAAQPRMQPHNDKPSHGTTRPHTPTLPHGKTEQRGMSGMHGMSGQTHRHDKWEPTPPAYASMQSSRWADLSAITRGKQLYQTHCMVCHGADGQAMTPVAKSLAHPPANLTQHFHRKPGDGDAYLFWRVSEGGMADPFKSMQSAMPPFKTILSADQRWDVLAYVHTYFHLGLTKWESDTQETARGTMETVLPRKDSMHHLASLREEIDTNVTTMATEFASAEVVLRELAGVIKSGTEIDRAIVPTVQILLERLEGHLARFQTAVGATQERIDRRSGRQ